MEGQGNFAVLTETQEERESFDVSKEVKHSSESTTTTPSPHEVLAVLARLKNRSRQALLTSPRFSVTP